MNNHVLSFSQFVNESKINEMRRGGMFGPRRHYRSSYRSFEYPQIDAKDQMRARELKLGVHGKEDPDFGGQQTINKSRKMAKAITDTGKLMGRMEAIYATYPENPEVVRPFVERVLELLPRSKYEAAYRIGKNDGRLQATVGTDSFDPDSFDMNDMGNIFADLGLAPPTMAFQGNSSEKIMYDFGYMDGEKEAAVA